MNKDLTPTNHLARTRWQQITGKVCTVCHFKQFEAILTPDTLIIQSDKKTDSFLLDRIKSISIFDNISKYRREIRKRERKQRCIYWFILTPVLAFTCLLLLPTWPRQVYGWLTTPFLSLLICNLLPVSADKNSAQSGLILETEKGSKTYVYFSGDVSGQSIASFLLQTRDQVLIRKNNKKGNQ